MKCPAALEFVRDLIYSQSGWIACEHPERPIKKLNEGVVIFVGRGCHGCDTAFEAVARVHPNELIFDYESEVEMPAADWLALWLVQKEWGPDAWENDKIGPTVR